jgi:predicted RNase H-like HicB family nuclease
VHHGCEILPGDLRPYERGYAVAFPDFPGCVTRGDGLQEAAAMAEEALSLHVEGMVDDGNTIPAPSDLNVSAAWRPYAAALAKRITGSNDRSPQRCPALPR